VTYDAVYALNVLAEDAQHPVSRTAAKHMLELALELELSGASLSVVRSVVAAHPLTRIALKLRTDAPAKKVHDRLRRLTRRRERSTP
jgi:hypothetical protein